MAGALLPLAFAPYGYTAIAVISLGVLFYLWQKSRPRQAFLYGYLFGLGLFGIGVNWLHISINTFGGVKLAGALAITFLLIAILALYPAWVGYISRRYYRHGKLRPLLAVTALWLLAEWLRSWLFTGFPWLNIGYTQTDTLLSALAPVVGVYGISWSVALLAAILVYAYLSSARLRLFACLAIASVYLILNILKDMSWTEPDENIPVALVQGAVPQEIKWHPEQRQKTLDTYFALSAQQQDSRLIIWPETAIPMFYDQAKPFLNQLKTVAKAQETTFLVGIPFRDKAKYYNGATVIGDHEDIYYKQHLVPFGEYLPFDRWLRPVLANLGIPVPDFTPGPKQKPIVRTGAMTIGISICYEAVFGEEIIAALPQANLLVNISNDAWFGDSIAPHQHLQMARMRALETGRYMLRATNTGISAIINQHGRIIAQSPQFVPHTTSANIQTFSGLTPYAKFGNWPIISSAFLLLIMIFIASRKTYST